MTVNENQNTELVALINCLESCKEGQEGLTKVFNEAENHKPGTGGVLREMWHMEKEAFFKDQRKNGRLEHNFHGSFICTYILQFTWYINRLPLDVLFLCKQHGILILRYYVFFNTIIILYSA